MNKSVAKWIVLPITILIAIAGVVTRILNLLDLSYLLTQLMMATLVFYFYLMLYSKTYGQYSVKHIVSFSIIAICALCIFAYSGAMVIGLFGYFASIKSALQVIMTGSYVSLMLIVILFYIINLSSILNPPQISKG